MILTMKIITRDIPDQITTPPRLSN